jgi:hypothetical protein
LKDIQNAAISDTGFFLKIFDPLPPLVDVFILYPLNPGITLRENPFLPFLGYVING